MPVLGRRMREVGAEREQGAVPTLQQRPREITRGAGERIGVGNGARRLRAGCRGQRCRRPGSSARSAATRRPRARRPARRDGARRPAPTSCRNAASTGAASVPCSTALRNAGSVCAANTSKSRAGPSAWASQRSSTRNGSMRAVAKPRRASERQARSRRTPMRIWWTHSGSSSSRRPSALASICARHDADDRREGVACERAAAQMRVGGVHGLARRRVAQRVASLRLGRGLQCQRHVGGERVRQFEQSRWIACLEFQFDFVHSQAARRIFTGGTHLTRVDAQQRERAVREGQRDGRAADIGDETCAQPLLLGFAERAAKRRGRESQRIELATRHRPFELGARAHAGPARLVRGPFDCLYPARAIATHPQGDPCAREAVLIGIEIRREQPRCSGASALQRGNGRVARQAGERLRRDAQLQFGFNRRERARAVARHRVES